MLGVHFVSNYLKKSACTLYLIYTYLIFNDDTISNKISKNTKTNYFYKLLLYDTWCISCYTNVLKEMIYRTVKLLNCWIIEYCVEIRNCKRTCLLIPIICFCYWIVITSVIPENRRLLFLNLDIKNENRQRKHIKLLLLVSQIYLTLSILEKKLVKISQ